MRISDWSSDVCSSDLDDVLLRGTPEHALAERGDHLAAVDHRTDLEAAFGAAVLLDDDGVLGDVDQAARQIAGVGRLQRGVGQALAGAVGGLEDFNTGGAFLEFGVHGCWAVSTPRL